MNLLEEFEKVFNNLTKEELSEWYDSLGKRAPHGWVDVTEYLPSVYCDDYLKKGYSVFKVKDINGKVKKTKVCDGMTWFHPFAKPNNITHWWNKW